MSLCAVCRAKADIITGKDAIKQRELGQYSDTVGHEIAHKEIIKIWLLNYGGQKRIEQFLGSNA